MNLFLIPGASLRTQGILESKLPWPSGKYWTNEFTLFYTSLAGVPARKRRDAANTLILRSVLVS